jgi:hypothetical protein
MTTINDALYVGRDSLGRTLVTADNLLTTLEDGEVILRIERFAITSNNITYAVMGKQM